MTSPLPSRFPVTCDLYVTTETKENVMVQTMTAGSNLMVRATSFHSLSCAKVPCRPLPAAARGFAYDWTCAGELAAGPLRPTHTKT